MTPVGGGTAPRSQPTTDTVAVAKKTTAVSPAAHTRTTDAMSSHVGIGVVRLITSNTYRSKCTTAVTTSAMAVVQRRVESAAPGIGGSVSAHR